MGYNGWEGVAVLSRVNSEVLTEEVTFEQRPEGGEAMWISGEGEGQAEGRAGAKALRQDAPGRLEEGGGAQGSSEWKG